MNPYSFHNRRYSSTILKQAPRRKKSPIPFMIFLGYLGAFSGIVSWWSLEPADTEETTSESQAALSVAARVQANPSMLEWEQKVIENIAEQQAQGVTYSGKYYSIDYPGGDVPANVGVSTDVVIRALRSIGFDLQEAIHLDRVANPSNYPLERWANRGPDTNVDHRRVVNVASYFQQHGEELDMHDWSSYRPGDLVFWRIGNGEFPDHVGIVVSGRSVNGVPLAAELHPKAGRLSVQTPVDQWVIRGHFRLPSSALAVAKN